MRIAVFFVGNRLMLDDGVAPAVYDYMQDTYIFPDNIDLFDVGCMSMDMISKVDDYDLIITVDAVDDTGTEPGTVFRYEPYDVLVLQVPALRFMSCDLPIFLTLRRCWGLKQKVCVLECRWKILSQQNSSSVLLLKWNSEYLF